MITTPDADVSSAQPALTPTRWWPLVVVAGLATVLAVVGVLPRWPGLAQEVGLPPLDLAADVRVLVATAPSPLVFVVGFVLALAVRTAMVATMLGSFSRRRGFVLRFYLVAAVPALLAAALDFSGRSLLYGYLVWAGLLITVVTLFVFAVVPWTGAERVRSALARAFHERLRAAVVLGYLVALVVVETAVREPGRFTQVIVVPISTLLTVLAIRRLTIRARRYVPSGVLVAVVGGVLVALLAAVVLVPGPSTSAKPRGRRAGSLFLVAGVDTASGQGALFHLDPRNLGFSCSQTFYYSYVGTGSGAGQRDARCPIRRGAPYGKADTLRPLDQLRATFLAQLAGLPRPVVVVSHSQGAWIAWAALARHDRRASGVDALLMLSPFNAGLASYPPPGRNGRGWVGGAMVRLVTDLGKKTSFSSFSADTPLVRELQASPGAIERLFDQRLDRSVRVLALVARYDLPLVPTGWPAPVHEACPGWVTHGAQPKSPALLSVASRFLGGSNPSRCPAWARAGAHIADAFGAPPPQS